MKINNPKTRYHIRLPKKYNVLDVGGGHAPHRRANIVVDKFADSNFHRRADLKVMHHQRFVEADGEDLPFKDHELDFVFCNHVLEHVDNPEVFLKEQARVSPRGYLEVPSLIGEILHPKGSHKWLILEIDEKIVMMDKKIVGFKASHDLGFLFLRYLPKYSLAYRLMKYTHGLTTVRYQWEGSVDVIVNPTEEKYTKYFTKVWTLEDYKKFYPTRSKFGELCNLIAGLFYVIIDYSRPKKIKKTL
ncbi:methyltransferase domain-containing protein [Aureispira]|nr:methyltransferase domain-containing protein [Aureispira sp.]